MKVRNSLNYNPAEYAGEKNYEPSMTVPDDALTVKEILTRYAKGLPLGGRKAELWEGEDDNLDGIDPKRLDYAEREELEERYTEELKQLKAKQAQILKKSKGEEGEGLPPSKSSKNDDKQQQQTQDDNKN